MGYLKGLTETQKQEICVEFKDNKQILIQCVKNMLNSKCETVILQMQDFLLQDETSRMNYPGIPEGCWDYRTPKNYKKTFKNTLKQIGWVNLSV